MKKNTMFVTQDELVKSGATTEQIESMLKEPQIGYHINRHRKLEQTYELAGKVFDGISEEIGDIAPQSCFRGTLKKATFSSQSTEQQFHITTNKKFISKTTKPLLLLVNFVKTMKKLKFNIYLSKTLLVAPTLSVQDEK